MRKEFTFRAEWAEVINALPVQDQLQLYRAVVRCGMEGLAPELEGTAAAVWKMGLGREVSASFSHWQAGCKGGCPKGVKKPSMVGNQNAQGTRKTKPKTKPKQNQITEDNEHINSELQKNLERKTKPKTKPKQNQIKGKNTPETPVNVFGVPENPNKHLIQKLSGEYIQSNIFSTDKEQYNHTPKERNTRKKESPPPRKCFVKPTLEQLEEYISQKGLTVDAAAFLDHYESNGWMVGRTAMKDWKAACRTWERQNKIYRRRHDNNERKDTGSDINSTAVRVLRTMAERERR